MRDSEENTPTHSTHQVGIGWYQPKALRISAFIPPAGNVLPPDILVPRLSMLGLWLERFGFTVGRKVLVEAVAGRITLNLDETPVVVPYRYRKHTPKKKRSRGIEQPR